MKYVCLGYFDKNAMDAKSPAEIDAIMAECGSLMGAMYETNKVSVDAGLSNETKRLQRVGGKVIVTDGPFAETKEMLGSVLIIDAKDFDDAVRIATLHPTTQHAAGERLGWRMEIRPIHYFKA